MHRITYRIRLIFSIFVLTGLTLSALGRPVFAQSAVVRAVLFYSPSCGHCHHVLQEVLPPLMETYGEQFEIVGIDVSIASGRELFLAAIEHYQVPESNQAVPMLVIDDQILLGSQEIPEKLPGLIEEHLAEGGLDWPQIPGLQAALEESESTPESEETTATAETAGAGTGDDAPQGSGPTGSLNDQVASQASILDRLQNDPAGNALAIVVLTGMLASLAGVWAYLRRNQGSRPGSLPSSLLIPVLCLVGAGVAGYLAYIETAQVAAVCGPVGDCNTVQQSEYARLFGVLPIGVLGLYGYAAIGIAWLASHFGRGDKAAYASLLLFVLALGGTLFSIYLTFLEPFVIGASCAWCLSSAVIMTGLLWLSTPAVQQILAQNSRRRTGSRAARQA